VRSHGDAEKPQEIKEERKTALTCDVEEDDARILPYFVGGSAPVEGVGLGSLDLQRARDLLGKHILILFVIGSEDSHGESWQYNAWVNN